MNLRHIVRLALAAPAVATLVACGGGSGSVVADTACPAVGNFTVTDIGVSQCQIEGTLTENATMSSVVTWFLEGRVQIGDAASLAVLDIDAGTQIRGDNVGSVDHVLVFPGSALQANGTAAAPVQFLSDDDNVTGTAEWGGVFLRGFNNSAIAAGATPQGANDLDYVVVAEAGDLVSVALAAETPVPYRDNIVVNGVDSNTTFTFVQSHNSARDGFHILNGDPRMSWLLATGAGRDGVWYRDFTGLIKDLMVIHAPDSDGFNPTTNTGGRSGIYASASALSPAAPGVALSNPRIVNATLVGRDNASTAAPGDATATEFGILFADNTNRVRMGNILIANFRNGCYQANDNADLSLIDTVIPGDYLDGVHCANEAGPNGAAFGVAVTGGSLLPSGTSDPANNNVNGNGLVYYNGAAGVLGSADTTFNAGEGGIQFTGEFADRSASFTAGWYLNNIRGLSNGLAAASTALNGFLDGDTNQDGVVNGDDNGSPFIISNVNSFNLDVAVNLDDDTFGYDMTHIGAVRSGAISASNMQFDGWTVATGQSDGFAVQQNP